MTPWYKDDVLPKVFSTRVSIKISQEIILSVLPFMANM